MMMNLRSKIQTERKIGEKNIRVDKVRMKRVISQKKKETIYITVIALV